MSRVILSYPNHNWSNWLSKTAWNIHPYNLCLLASVIENKHDVSIIDSILNNFTEEQFAQKISEKNPDILGISVITNEYANSGLTAAKIAKKINPDIKTVLGGVSAVSNPEPLINDKNVDYVVVGEGEYAFKDLCNFLSGEGNFPEKGVWYKNKEGIVRTGRTEPIQNLDEIPLPAYHLVDFLKYANKIQRESTEHPRKMPYARIRTSRGCPCSCCFCEVNSISGKKQRFRSLENVAKEIECLKSEYGIKFLEFDDDNLVFNQERAKSLFKMMRDKNYNLEWIMPGTAVNRLDEEMIDLMKQSGCVYLNIAIESGVERVLKDIIHKPVDLTYAKKMINYLKKSEIDLCANFVIGFPGESWDEIRQTIKFAEDINIDYVKIFIATPFPNTNLYEQVVQGNYLRKDYTENKHLWTDGWIETPEFRPADLRILRAYEWDRINFSNSKKREKIAKMMGITEERLNEIRKETLKLANP